MANGGAILLRDSAHARQLERAIPSRRVCVIRTYRAGLAAIVALLVFPGTPAIAEIQRTAEGLPDLTGTYDIRTITPLQRPQTYGDNLYLTAEQVQEIESRRATSRERGAEASDPNRGAPPAGGDGSPGAAGNVGGYNTFWIDPGDTAFKIDGKFRTSILTQPANGRRPSMTPAARERRTARRAFFRPNRGDAWWLELAGPGPYDGPESRTLSDRCLLGFGSTGGPPMLPTLYNNAKRIVQTPDHVLILVEMIHDARVIRLNSKHAPASVKKWLGDSIGWWEGDTLVVETTNFKSRTTAGGDTEGLKVLERFTRVDEKTLNYAFTVDQPQTWSEPWGGEYPWPQSDTRVYEYACHEANYAMEGILKGARILEADALAETSGN